MDDRRTSLTLHHLGILVEDIPRAAASLAGSIGAGPFFELPQVELDPLSVETQMPGRLEWTHSIAFGFCASVLVELTHTTMVTPGPVGVALSQVPLNHLAFAASDWDDAVNHLVAEGAERLFTVRSAQIHTAYLRHPILGTIEVIRDTASLAGLVSAIREVSESWDGFHPHRLGTPASASTSKDLN